MAENLLYTEEMTRWTVLTGLVLVSPAHAIRFKIYDLGAIGNSSTAQSVNDAGMVVGNLAGARCFVWTEQTGMFRPGPLFDNVNTNNWTMYKVNNAGQAACSITWPINGQMRLGQPALWTFGRGFKVIALPGFQGNAQPYGLSDNGFVAGTWNSASPQQGFVWSEATGFRTIGRLSTSGGSAAFDVDSFGNAVGVSFVETGRLHAVRYSPALGLTDLGTLPLTEDSLALCMNDSGLILGYCESISLGTYKPFWIRPGHQMEELPQGPEGLITEPDDVNQKGQFVGWGGNGQEVTAMFYEPGIGVLDLTKYVDGGTAGIDLRHAKGINEHGDIVGTGILNGKDRAFFAKRLD